MRICKIREGVRYEQKERGSDKRYGVRKNAKRDQKREERTRGIHLVVVNLPRRTKAFSVESQNAAYQKGTGGA